MATTVSGQQINRRWTTLGGIGLLIVAVAGSLRHPALQVKNPAGNQTWVVDTDGNMSGSGWGLFGSGSQTAFYWSTATARAGVRTRSPRTEFEVVGAISGTTLSVSRAFSGAGLTDCDTGGSSKLLWDSSAGKFSCGTDQNTIYGSGNVIAVGDGRYVRKSGDTMTGVLVIQNGNTHTPTGLALLNVRGLASGTTIYATTAVRSSGALTWEGPGSGASLYLGTSLNGAGLIDCDTAGTSKLLWDSTSGRFSCGTDTDTNTTYTAGQGLTLNGTSFSLNAAHSGSVIKAATTLASSGTLVFEGAASGSSLYLGTSLQGAGLVDCDTATQTLAWDATTGRFSCGTDSDTTYTAGQGLTLNGSSFSLTTSHSGTTIWATTALRSSGTLVFEGAASGSSLYLGTSLNGAGLVADCDTAGSSKLLWDITTGRFSCGSDQTGATGAAQGLSTIGSSLRLNATITGSLVSFQTVSGSVVKAKATVASSGTLVWEGAGSGSSLYLGTSLQGAGLTDCDTATQTLAWDATTGRFSCGTDSDTTYTAGQGLTLTNSSFKLNTTITGSLVNFTTVSGSVLKAKNSLNSSGTLVFEGAGSGARLTATTLSGTIVRAAYLSPRVIQMTVVGTGSTVATGSGKAMFTVIQSMSGYLLGAADISVGAAGTTNTTCVQIRNLSKGSRKLFSAPLCLGSGRTNSGQVTINSTNRDVSMWDRLMFDIPNVSTTAPKADLNVNLYFYKP